MFEDVFMRINFGVKRRSSLNKILVHMQEVSQADMPAQMSGEGTWGSIMPAYCVVSD